MKKHLIAAAVAAAFAVPAMAQVTISGSISTGIVDTGAPGAKAQVARIGGGTNAINLSATEDLGGGLRGGFTGQIRFNPASGDFFSDSGSGTAGQNGFHAANVFIGGGFGTIRVGKIAEDSNCGFDPWGCLTGAGSLATGTAGILTAAGTQGNSVMYASPNIQGFGVSFQTTLNRATEDRQILNLNYSAGPISAQYLLARGSAAAGGTNSGFTGGTKGEQDSLGLSYNFGVARLIYSMVRAENAAGVRNKDIQYVAASVPLGAAAIWAAYSKDDKAPATADTAWAVGINYALSKRTSVGADVFDKEVAGGSTGFALRARHTF
jgi:predicted porin